MNDIKKYLTEALDKYKAEGYKKLLNWVDNKKYHLESFELKASDGNYQVEINIQLEDRTSKHIRVEATAYQQDGNWWRKFISSQNKSTGFIIDSEGHIEAY